MKVTFLTPGPNLTGGARVISIYARELAKRGCEVQVMVPRGSRPDVRSIIRQLLKGRLPPQSAWQPSHYDGIEPLVRRLDRLGPITATECPDADVVIATWWETAQWMLAMPPSKGRRFHFVQHYEAFSEDMKPKVDAVLAADTRKITISRWLERMLVERFGNSDVTLIPNGVDMGQFNAARRERNPHPTVGMLYHDAPFKNTNAGVAAFVKLQRHFPDARLVAFGENEPSDDVPLPPDAIYYRHPAQHAIRDIYASCDVWLCPSKAEGFYLPLLEAMACRCPVISTPVGGPLDLIVEGDNGYIVPHDDGKAMGDRLIAFFEADGARWRRMSDAAHATALRHNWSLAADKFAEALSRS